MGISGMVEVTNCFVSSKMLEKPVFMEDTVIKNIDSDYSVIRTKKYGVFRDALEKHFDILDCLCKLGVRIQNGYFEEIFQDKLTKGRVRLTRSDVGFKVSSYTVFSGNKVSVLLEYRIEDGVLKGLNCEDIKLEGTLLSIFIKVLDALLDANEKEVIATYNLMVLNDILSGLATNYKVKLVDKPKADKHVISNIGIDYVELIVDKVALLDLQDSEIEKMYLKDPAELAENIYGELNILEFLTNIKDTVISGYVSAARKLGARKRVRLLSLIRKDFRELDLETKHHLVYGYYKLDDDIVRLYTMSEENIYVNTVAFELDTNDFVEVIGEMYQFDSGKLVKLR
jgi:hypothetical protein